MKYGPVEKLHTADNLLFELAAKLLTKFSPYGGYENPRPITPVQGLIFIVCQWAAKND